MKSVFERINVDASKVRRYQDDNRGPIRRYRDGWRHEGDGRRHEGDGWRHEERGHLRRREESSPYAPTRQVRRADSNPARRVIATNMQNEEEDRWVHDLCEGAPANEPASCIFVRGLDSHVQDSRLRAWFEDCYFKVCFLKVDRAPLTTAVVGFSTRDAAAKVLKAKENQTFGGQKLKLMEYEKERVSSKSDVEKRREIEELEQERMRRELDHMKRRQRGDRPLRHEQDLEFLSSPTTRQRRHVTMAANEPRQSIFNRVAG